MKKSSYFAVLSTLIVILLLSFIVTTFVIKDKNATSETFCINDRVSEDMDIVDIASLYRDNVAVAVRTSGFNSRLDEAVTSLGSGVVIASVGYESYYDKNVEARVFNGSYIATNYHCIDSIFDDDYLSVSVSIITDDEREYSCEVIWTNKDFDVAILYCEAVELNYVHMIDKSIEGNFDIERVFTIGTPLSLQYLNRVTFGNIASDNDITMATTNSYYYYFDGGRLDYTTSSEGLEEGITYYQIATLNNVYEYMIDISLGISPGNSGGGIFDGDGNLIGLATASTSFLSTNGNQMNGAAPIYPIIEVIDRVIANNENGASYQIYSLDSLGIVGIDSNEATYSSYLREEYKDELTAIGLYQYYIFDDERYIASTYQQAFSFAGNGVYVLGNNGSLSELSEITKDCIIREITLNEQNFTIKNRNDLGYLLIKLHEGDILKISYQNTYGSLEQVELYL